MQTEIFLFGLYSIQTPDSYDPMTDNCAFSLKGLLTFLDSELAYCTCHSGYLQLSGTCKLMCFIWFQVIHIYVRWIVTVDHALHALWPQWLNVDVATWIVKYCARILPPRLMMLDVRRNAQRYEFIRSYTYSPLCSLCTFSIFISLVSTSESC
jgi:hypothetical protein